MAADERQVLCRFITKLPAELRVPDNPVVGWQDMALHFASRLARALAFLLQAVPATLKRYGLSQIINHILCLGEHNLGKAGWQVWLLTSALCLQTRCGRLISSSPGNCCGSPWQSI
jgi:hypothetical protein